MESDILIGTLLSVGLVALSLLSLNLVALTLARLLVPERRLKRASLSEENLPRVLVQLPLYNEGDLVGRILNAVTALDWPRDRLEIQVLDDSTDGSCNLSRQSVEELRDAGFPIELLHRTRRSAYKAGALAAGLVRSDAPFVAIFDADFIPGPSYLRETVGVLVGDPSLAFVQTRWGHLNPGRNFLTRAQMRLLDAHFRVEQEARFRLGLPVPFNGTCGVWRRAAILDAGGWQGDTLTEDLDLSLRARLRGWRSAYLNDVLVPGSLPESAQAWRAQQFRWAKGFAQCAIKLSPQVWRSDALPIWQRLMVTLQMAQPLAFLLGAACTLLGLPYIAGAVVASPELGRLAVAASLLGMLGTLGFLAAGVSSETRARALRELVGTLFLTTGLLLSNARAGIEALLGHRSEFVRTPKPSAERGSPPGSAAALGYYGVMEVGAGLGLLGFALLERPLSAFYLTLVIGGLLVLGLMQLFDGRDPLRPIRAWR
jgi:cellulose synthase/poly-beta-1,6-N-acetylglucosamine synthase-like glycosyltransferase